MGLKDLFIKKLGFAEEIVVIEEKEHIFVRQRSSIFYHLILVIGIAVYQSLPIIVDKAFVRTAYCYIYLIFLVYTLQIRLNQPVIEKCTHIGTLLLHIEDIFEDRVCKELALY